MMSDNLTLKNSTGVSPALRATNDADGMCLPLQHNRKSSVLALLIAIVKLKSLMLTFPAPRPPDWVAELTLWLAPQDHDSTLISSLCVLSIDSPLTPSILRKKSVAMFPLSVHERSEPPR